MKYYTAKEAAIELSTSAGVVKSLIKEQKFPGAIKPLKKWMIPEEDIIELRKKSAVPDGFITVNDFCSRTGLNETSTYALINENKIPGAYRGQIEGTTKTKKLWLIPADYEIAKAKLVGSYEAANILNCSQNEVTKMVRQGLLPNAVMTGGKYQIPIEDLAQVKSMVPSQKLKPRYVKPGYVNLSTATVMLNTSIMTVYVLLKQGVFPNAFKESWIWNIPEKELLEYKETLYIYLGPKIILCSFQKGKYPHQKVREGNKT